MASKHFGTVSCACNAGSESAYIDIIASTMNHACKIGSQSRLLQKLSPLFCTFIEAFINFELQRIRSLTGSNCLLLYIPQEKIMRA